MPGISKDEGEPQEMTTGVEDLPPIALELVYKFCTTRSRKALLRTCRAGREVVLGEAQVIQLHLRPTDPLGPVVRFLARASQHKRVYKFVFTTVHVRGIDSGPHAERSGLCLLDTLEDPQ
jgi:hypothetical protein